MRIFKKPGHWRPVTFGLSWEADDLKGLSDALDARKLPRESRDASMKLGRRFAGLVNAMLGSRRIEPNLHYCVA